MTIGCPHGLDQPQYVAPLLLLLACWVASSAPTVPSSSSRHAVIYQPCVSSSPLPTSSSLFVRYRYTRLRLLPSRLTKRVVMPLYGHVSLISQPRFFLRMVGFGRTDWAYTVSRFPIRAMSLGGFCSCFMPDLCQTL